MPTDSKGYYFGRDGAKATPEWIRSLDRPSGAELTTGNIGRLASHAASTDETIAKLDSALADLSKRLDRIETQRRDEAAFLAKRRR
jgi:hypothetical protein